MTIHKTINIILAWLLIFSLVGTISLFIMLNNNQGNAKVVNYTGIVRGGVQRLVKLEMAKKDSSELITKTEKIIQGLLHGDSDLNIQPPQNAEFIHQMQGVETFWNDQLKPKILSYKEDKNSEALISSSEEFFELTNQAVSTAEASSSQGIQNIKLVNLIIFLLNALCILLISFIIYKKILIPIRAIQQTAEELSEGHLKTTLVYKANDELGHLANSMRSTQEIMQQYIGNISDILEQLSQGDMKINIELDYRGDFGKIKHSLLNISTILRKTMIQIGTTSNQVAANSDQVSHGSQSLSEGATEQASSIQKLTANIDMISSQVKKTAENALIAREKSTTLTDKMLVSDTQMTQMLKAMENINQSAQEISKIIKTIEDIAFQTNILALNASVEAARAGVSGKGFAVVANEVRNLASKSAEASQNTSTLIETSIAAVYHGTQIANTTANTLITAVNDAKEVTKIIKKISEASHEEAQSITQVTHSMGEISSIIQMNSATAEESAAASSELSNQAQVMKNLVRKFKF